MSDTTSDTKIEINITSDKQHVIIDNGLFDDVWDLTNNKDNKSVNDHDKSITCEWDDILNVYEPTRVADKPIKPQPVKHVTPIVKPQPKKTVTKNTKPVISMSSKKVVSKVDDDDYDDDYDDTYDNYY